MLPAYGRNGRNCEVALLRKILPLPAGASVIWRGGNSGKLGNLPPCLAERRYRGIRPTVCPGSNGEEGCLKDTIVVEAINRSVGAGQKVKVG